MNAGVILQKTHVGTFAIYFHTATSCTSCLFFSQGNSEVEPFDKKPPVETNQE